MLRLGLAFLFLWFGISQMTNPTEWLSWLPAWTSALSIAPTTIVFLNGGFETVLGALLAIGFLTRWVAALLAVHLLVIAYEIGYNDIGIRDFSLAIATTAVALFGADDYSIDAWRKTGLLRTSVSSGTKGL